MKHPIRLTIAALLRDGKPRTARDVFEALRPQYPGERQLSPDAVDGHLQALKAVGIVRIAEETLEAGTLTLRSASTARAVSSASCNAEKRIRRPAKPFLQRSPPCPAVPRRTPPALPGCPARGPAAHRLSGLEAQHFRLPRAGVHTALETCGLADWETFRELVPHLDLFLYDIKYMDRPTGGSRARAAGGFWTTCACCSAWAKRF